MNRTRRRFQAALLAGFLVVLANLAPRPASAAQATQTTPAAEQSDPSAAKSKKPNSTTEAASATASQSSKSAPAATPLAPAATTAPAAQQPAPANSNAMVWVNTESGICHKPGSHYFGKTKQGKYMTEADAIKAGYRPSEKR